MDKKIILATAGSGKTYYIANHFSQESHVLLTTFTNGNVENIRQEVRKRFNGIIPENISIMTFDKFVYNLLLKPLEPLLSFPGIKSNGVDIYTKVITDTKDRNYVKEKYVRHFMNQQNEYYVIRMSKLFVKQKAAYKRRALERIEKYFDTIYFDEFQDYNGNNFKVLKYLIENLNIDAYAVGDIYQSNVAPIRNDGNGSSSPFNKIEKIGDLIPKFSTKVTFDTTTLVKSRRVSSSICNIIREKMNIEIYPLEPRESEIIVLKTYEEIHAMMVNKDIPKLVWNASSEHDKGKGYINWSYSKGDTYDSACVILTKKASNFDKWNELALSTRNKLYVALTRSRGDLYLIKDENYKQWKQTFS